MRGSLPTSRARPKRQRSQKVQPGSVDCHLLAGLEESQKLLCLGVPFLDCSKAPLLVTSYGGSKLEEGLEIVMSGESPALQRAGR